MKIVQKKRIEQLEGILYNKSKKKRFAIIIYDADSGFDPSTLEIDAEAVLFLPDNGMRIADEVDYSQLPYQIMYG